MASPGENMTVIATIAHELNLPKVMFDVVGKMAKEHFEFDAGQRKLLITACKVIFSPKHRNLRIISAMEQGGYHIKYIRELLENDMQATCRDALNILEKHLLPFCKVTENATLYNKMKGDIHLFLAMLKKEEDKETLVEKTLAAYKTASKEAKSPSPAHPLQLELHLTKTAFYHDVMNLPKRAYDLGKKALDEARPKLVLLDKECHKESTLCMGLIEENLKMWETLKDPEDTLSLKETYFQTVSSSSTGCPCPVVPISVPAVAPDNFTSPGDWDYDEGLSTREIRSRRKAALMKKGRMG